MLRGRQGHRDAIGRLIDGAREGRGGALVLRGEAGIGKTALLDEAAATAEGVRVLRATGVEAETALPFAALQMLLRPAPRTQALPPAQARALHAALGLPAPDPATTDPDDPDDPDDSDGQGGRGGAGRFLTALAVLNVLSDLASDRPVLCLVDDAHWLDPASADALLFAARRLDAEGAAIVFAAREGFAAPGLPALPLDGLDRPAAAALLAERSPGLDDAVRDRILDEASGNPLALLELPAALSAAERAGHRPPPPALPVTGRVIAAFGTRIERLPQGPRLALSVAAAEGTGDLAAVLRAARLLGAAPGDLDAAVRAGLLRITGTRARFRHPLVRAAAYQLMPLTTRLAVHGALAEVSDGARRALHRAAASPEPDEDVAAELEESAAAARERGAPAAAAGLYEHAARLSPAEADRTRRLIRAAQAAITGGRTGHAADLAGRAAAMPLGPVPLAEVAMVRATAEFERGAPPGTARHLADSAVPVAGTDPGLALTLLVMAAGNAWSAGEDGEVRRIAGLAAGIGAAAVGTCVTRAAGETASAAAALVGLGRVAAGDAASGLPLLRDVVEAARVDPPGSLIARLLVLSLALLLGDDGTAAQLAAADAAHARHRGLAGALPATLQVLAQTQAAAGLHRDAAATAAEALALARETGQRHREARLAAVTARIAAIEGDRDRCRALAAATAGSVAEAAAAGACALGLLDLGLGRHHDALRVLEEAAAGPARRTAAVAYAAADLAEAAVGAGDPQRARVAAGRLTAWAAALDRPWVSAVALRCRALLDPSEETFQAAMRLHAAGGPPFEHARTALLHGAWLRRERRRADARGPLRLALSVFERLGAAPWADRARGELRATGGTVPAPDGGPDPLDRLTPQELQIVRLAASGAGNREIAARLFLSHRTVEYHLYKAFPKLGVTSRTELARFA
ncbi:helix-turn-helix domain-containing protein [Actinomadura graeca]|uniref:Helix-turn-helix domain-containing protein n=1 Tax=Actinomadura graeca TaxID=2750812 RepID=A0ABX8QSI6_9ACTN|nr:LuxR family transcriptional regulator [Actinomadura graeca]QXJ19763.1 helix-turn-helix domain-containing protein [Actinomadura graeca]